MTVLSTQALYTGTVLDGDKFGAYHFGMTPLEKLFEKKGLTATKAARQSKTLAQPEIYRWLKGQRPITKRGAVELAPLLETTPEALLFQERMVRIVGKVGAAGEAHYAPDAESDAYLGLARLPQRGGPQTVAVEIEGDSMGPGLNGWLAYYDDRREPPTDDLIAQLCVVAINTGQIVIKRLFRGRAPGRFDLWPGAYGDPIIDQALIWAAKVIDLAPADAKIEESQDAAAPEKKSRARS